MMFFASSEEVWPYFGGIVQSSSIVVIASYSNQLTTVGSPSCSLYNLYGGFIYPYYIHPIWLYKFRAIILPYRLYKNWVFWLAYNYTPILGI